jgi:hypothetical protein
MSSFVNLLISFFAVSTNIITAVFGFTKPITSYDFSKFSSAHLHSLLHDCHQQI